MGEFPEDTHKMLIKLLCKFEIFTSIKDKNQYIVPCLLSSEQPDISDYWKIKPNQIVPGLVFSRKYKFPFLPFGFFSRVLVRSLQIPGFTVESYWETGHLMKYKSAVGLIRYNPTTYCLHLQIHAINGSSDARNYKDSVKMLRLAVENIDTTIEGWYTDSDPIITIPCSHCLSESGYSQWEFPLSQCMEATASGNLYVHCKNVRKVRLDVLAPDISLSDLRKLVIPFDDLKLIKDIGEGAYGVVYKAKYNGKIVAVKEIVGEETEQLSKSISALSTSDTINGSQFLEFKREVWLMNTLNHPNVCSLVGISLNPLAMVMEFMEKGDLFHLIGHRKVRKYTPGQKIQSDSPALLHDMKVKIKLIYDIVRGMNHLHSFDPPVIHRDLRSPNVFINSLDINEPTCALVGDFGLSRVTGATLNGGKFNQYWLAPEVMKNESYTGKMDVYSFGIIIWEILTLERPFLEYLNNYVRDKTGSEFKQAVINGLRPTIPRICPPNYKQLIEKCWAGCPDDRPNFSEIIEMVEELMDDFGVPLGEESYEEPATTRLDMESIGDILVVDEGNEVASLTKTLALPQNDTIISMISIQNNVWVAVSEGKIHIYNSKQTSYNSDINLGNYIICSMTHLKNGTVWIGTASGKIFVYSEQGKYITVIKEHTTAVVGMAELCLANSENRIGKSSNPISYVLSADIDGNIFAWRGKPSKPRLKNKLKIQSHIASIITSGPLLYIGSEGSIFVYDAITLELVRECKGHSGIVNSMIMHQKKLWSCSADGTILVWRGNCKIGELKCHSSKVFTLMGLNNHVFAGSFDKTISVWNSMTHELEQELKHHKDGVSSLFSIGSDTFWSGSLCEDGTIGIWKCHEDLQIVSARY